MTKNSNELRITSLSLQCCETDLDTNLLSVHRLVRSNMNKIATASLHAIGTWSTDWLSPASQEIAQNVSGLEPTQSQFDVCIYLHTVPATSQMLNASLAPRTASVLSIRFRPVICNPFCSSPSPTYLTYRNQWTWQDIVLVFADTVSNIRHGPCTNVCWCS